MYIYPKRKRDIHPLACLKVFINVNYLVVSPYEGGGFKKKKKLYIKKKKNQHEKKWERGITGSMGLYICIYI